MVLFCFCRVNTSPTPVSSLVYLRQFSGNTPPPRSHLYLHNHIPATKIQKNKATSSQTPRGVLRKHSAQSQCLKVLPATRIKLKLRMNLYHVTSQDAREIQPSPLESSKAMQCEGKGRWDGELWLMISSHSAWVPGRSDRQAQVWLFR